MASTALDRELELLEDAQSSTLDFDESPPPDLVAYNELRSCAELFRMHSEGQLHLDPDFQREEVWPLSSQTRFVDSLVKQLPIPSLCFSYDFVTSERQVVDGRQRIASIIKFLDSKNWKLSRLGDIDQTISNRTNADIRTKYPLIYSQVQNATIPVTVLRCDLTKESHRKYLFTIFHRLNAGGMRLNNQEIRNCIYSGALNDFLKYAADRALVRQLFGRGNRKSRRFSNEELILRILSFQESHHEYVGPLSKHLNEFMAKHRNPDPSKLEEVSHRFRSTAELVFNQLDDFDGSDISSLSKATREALFVGILRNFERVTARDVTKNRKCLEELLNDQLFSTEALKDGLAARDKVIARLDRAVEIFS